MADRRLAREEKDGSSRRPVPPALLRYRVSENLDPEIFRAVGENAGVAIESALVRAGKELGGCRNVLDFGCGCGRVLLPLASRYPGIRFQGADVDAEAIAWCRSHIAEARFDVNPPLPPLPYAGAEFDLVYCVSVFTHLSDEYQRQWLPELRRILGPDGTLLLTFHGESVWQNLPPERRARIEREGHLFERSTKLKGVVPDWYHTAYHRQAYAIDLVSEHFRVLEFLPAGMGYQDILVAAPR
jgi:SAM-dependent methyltransferase